MEVAVWPDYSLLSLTDAMGIVMMQLVLVPALGYYCQIMVSNATWTVLGYKRQEASSVTQNICKIHASQKMDLEVQWDNLAHLK